MNANRNLFCILAIAVITSCASTARAVVIATSKGAGADAEVRDHQPGTNFGASSELGTRIVDNFPEGNASDGNDRFGAIYLKFDITGQVAIANQSTYVRLTYRNTNLTPNRIHDTTPPGNNFDFRTGIAFYGLDRDHAGNSWTEGGINYGNAPGIASDGDNGTKDFDFADPDGAGLLRAPLTPLGVALFPVVAPQNRLPVGGQLLFTNDALNSFVTSSLNAGKTSVTIVASIVHDGKVPINDWKNFLYLFNPKEQTTLTTDTGYDADTGNPTNPLGSGASGASNATNGSGFSPFSPQLIIAPQGDFNFDGSVTAADYVTWRKSNGTFAAYDAWRRNFGNSAGSGAGGDSFEVPEPHSAILCLLVAMVGYLTRVRAEKR